MGKYLLIALTVTGLIGFTGCDESDNDQEGVLPGNWLLVYDYGESTTPEQSYTWGDTYDDIFRGMILQLTETTAAFYYNYACTEDWGTDSSEPGPYILGDGNTITITWYYWETRIVEYDYTLSGNELTLSRTWDDSSGSGSSIMRLEKYTDSFPPSVWTAAIYDDAYEPDDNVASASSIPVGGAEQEHTLPINDVDWFTFSAQSGTSYIVTTTGGWGPEINIYAADGELMLVTNDEYWSIYWTCEETDTYSIKVDEPGTTESCGKYGISVTTGSSAAKATGLWKEKKTMRHGLFRR